MYTEGFEGLEDAHEGPRRTYVSHASQEDSDRIFRENERLKKSVEKEKFFNKLLDQEIKDLKTELANRSADSDYHNRKGVSRGSFYTLLFVSLIMAGFIGYTLYYDKQYHLPLNGRTDSPEAIMPPVTTSDNTVEELSEGQESQSTTAGEAAAAKEKDLVQQNDTRPAEENTPVLSTPAQSSALPPFRDSVPNIIGKKSAAALQTPRKQETNADGNRQEEAAADAAVISSTPVPVTPSRPVIGRYRVTSKANFYGSPDENTLRSAFIRQSSDKIVNALEEKNGFIYVEYVNDLGYTTKGWLSKRDLTKAE